MDNQAPSVSAASKVASVSTHRQSLTWQILSLCNNASNDGYFVRGAPRVISDFNGWSSDAKRHRVDITCEAPYARFKASPALPDLGQHGASHTCDLATSTSLAR